MEDRISRVSSLLEQASEVLRSSGRAESSGASSGTSSGASGSGSSGAGAGNADPTTSDGSGRCAHSYVLKYCYFCISDDEEQGYLTRYFFCVGFLWVLAIS